MNILNNNKSLIHLITVGIIIAGLVFSVFVGDPGHSVIILGLFIIYSALFIKKIIPGFFSILFLTVVVLMVLGTEEVFSLYRYFIWYDKVVHFAAEFVLTLLAGYLLIKTNLIEFKNIVIFFIIVVCIGVTLGAVWEIIEWIITLFIPPSFDFTAFDTATDLVIDSLGAIAAGFVSLRWLNTDKL